MPIMVAAGWRNQLVVALALAIVGALAAYVLYGRPPLLGVDDANITFIYGRNIAAGHGFVYTPGLRAGGGLDLPLLTLAAPGIARLHALARGRDDVPGWPMLRRLAVVGVALSLPLAAMLQRHLASPGRFDFVLAASGRVSGTMLNSLRTGADGPPPVLGVTAAGGVAYAFAGRAYDLYGLNWAAMAHASPRKTGFYGHSSFDREVFWTAPIDVILLHALSKPRDAPFQVVYPIYRDSLGPLLDDPRLVETFQPFALVVGDRRLDLIGRRDWLARATAAVGARIEPLPWGTLLAD